MFVIFCLFKQKYTYMLGIGCFLLKLLVFAIQNISAINFKFVRSNFGKSTDISGQEYGILLIKYFHILYSSVKFLQ